MLARFLGWRPAGSVRSLMAVAAIVAWPCQGMAAPLRSHLHVLQALQGEFNPAVLAPSYVDGVALQIPWTMVEPSRGHYDWRRVDAVIGEARRHGKQVTLHVLPLRPPEWLFQLGAEEFRFTMGASDSPMRGRVLREVVPWDPVFLEQWSAMTRALGVRYARNDTVLAVSVTAPSPEMVLPGAIPGTPAFEDMRRRYRKDVYLAAWTRMIDVYQEAFPATPKLLVPGIVLFDEYFADEVLAYAQARFGDKLWLFNTGLRADGVPQAKMGTGHVADLLVPPARHRVLGLQTIWSATDDPRDRMRGPLGEVLDEGLQMGGTYFEVYSIDVLNPGLQGVLTRFRRKLAAVSSPRD